MSNTDPDHEDGSPQEPAPDSEVGPVPESQELLDHAAAEERREQFRKLRATVEGLEPGLVECEDSRWRCACCGSDQVLGFRAMWVGGAIHQTDRCDEPEIPFDADPWPIEGISPEYSCMACGQSTVLVDQADL